MNMKEIKELTEFAIEKKMLIAKVGDIELHFHPAAFMVHSDLNPIKEEELTEEEQLIRDKKQLDSDLFHSA